MSEVTTKSPIAAFGGFMEKIKPQLAMALPKHLTADRMARLAMTAFSTTPKLQECDPTSIAASIMTAGQLRQKPLRRCWHIASTLDQSALATASSSAVNRL